MPLNASEAMSGSPSPWKVLATTAVLPRKRERRESCSVRESSVGVLMIVAFSCYYVREEVNE